MRFKKCFDHQQDFKIFLKDQGDFKILFKKGFDYQQDSKSGFKSIYLRTNRTSKFDLKIFFFLKGPQESKRGLKIFFLKNPKDSKIRFEKNFKDQQDLKLGCEKVFRTKRTPKLVLRTDRSLKVDF